jgi:hypothetical protein
MYYKPTTNIILSCEKLKAFLKDQNQDKDAHSPQVFSTAVDILLRSTRQQKKKGIQIVKEKVQSFLQMT